jgi:hypothetical protein
LERSLSTSVAEDFASRLADGFSQQSYFESDASAVEVPSASPNELTLSDESFGQSVETISLEGLTPRENAKRKEQTVTVCTEEYIKMSGRDSLNVNAFATAFNELMSLMQGSSKFPVARWFYSDKQRRFDCRPSVMDFSAELFIAARESLTLGQYLVLKAHAEHNFVHWSGIDKDLRKTIAERVGATLVRKRIVVRCSTREYFTKNLQRAA